MELTTTPVIEQFVAALAGRDLAATITLYAPAAVFESHVPDWDGLTGDRNEIGDWLDSFFISKEDFRIVDYQILQDGELAALRVVLRWWDAANGHHCRCFQSHFFDLEKDQILVHRMYCSGVRVLGEAVKAVAA